MSGQFAGNDGSFIEIKVLLSSGLLTEALRRSHTEGEAGI